MTEISQRILDMVRRELVEHPDVENGELYEKARRLDPDAMKDVDRRQFNARYPLRVKRFELKSRKPKDAAPRRTPRKPVSRAAERASVGSDVAGQLDRDGVRDIFLRFAQELANADSRGEIVSVVAGVDAYVEQVIGVRSHSKS